VYDVVVKKFTFAVSSRDELLVPSLASQVEAPGQVVTEKKFHIPLNKVCEAVSAIVNQQLNLYQDRNNLQLLYNMHMKRVSKIDCTL